LFMISVCLFKLTQSEFQRILFFSNEVSRFENNRRNDMSGSLDGGGKEALNFNDFIIGFLSDVLFYGF